MVRALELNNPPIALISKTPTWLLGGQKISNKIHQKYVTTVTVTSVHSTKWSCVNTTDNPTVR